MSDTAGGATTWAYGGIDRIFDAIEAVVPGVVHSVVQMAVWDAICEFCTRSTYWRARVTWTMPVGTTTVDLSQIDVNTVGMSILQVGGGLYRNWRIDPPCTLVDLGPGTQDRSGWAIVSCLPVNLDAGLPSFLIDNWSEALRDGALFRLYSQPSKPYTSPQLAAFHGKRFASRIQSARAQIIHDGPPNWRFPYFARGAPYWGWGWGYEAPAGPTPVEPTPPTSPTSPTDTDGDGDIDGNDPYTSDIDGGTF